MKLRTFRGNRLSPTDCGSQEWALGWRLEDRRLSMMKLYSCPQALRGGALSKADVAFAGEFQLRVWNNDLVTICYRKARDLHSWDPATVELPKASTETFWEHAVAQKVSVERNLLALDDVLTAMVESGGVPASSMREQRQRLVQMIVRRQHPWHRFEVVI